MSHTTTIELEISGSLSMSYTLGSREVSELLGIKSTEQKVFVNQAASDVLLNILNHVEDSRISFMWGQVGLCINRIRRSNRVHRSISSVFYGDTTELENDTLEEDTIIPMYVRLIKGDILPKKWLSYENRLLYPVSVTVSHND